MSKHLLPPCDATRAAGDAERGLPGMDRLAPLAMMSAAAERLTLEADVDMGVASRVLDLLCAVDRFPNAMTLRREGATITIEMALDLPSDVRVMRTPVLAARMRQIPGVRRVVSVERT